MTRLLLACLVLAFAAAPVAAEMGQRDTAERARDFERRGDDYMKAYSYRCAAQCYKTALRYDPENRDLWEKHRRSSDRFRVVENHVQTARDLASKGYFEEATEYMRLALKVNPYDEVLWKMYEDLLAHNPHVAAITTEREAWDAYENGRKAFEDKRYGAARRYFGLVMDFTKDAKLRFQAKKYLEKTETRIQEDYPNLRMRVADR